MFNKKARHLSLAFALVVSALALPTLGGRVVTVNNPNALRLLKRDSRSNAKAAVVKSGAAEAPIDITVQHTLPEKLANQVVPLVNSYVSGLTIDGITDKHFEFDSFKISSFGMYDVQANFIDPNAFQLRFGDFELAIPEVRFFIFIKIFGHKVGCHGHFWANTNGDVVTSDIGLQDNNGRLALASDSGVTINYGTLNIQHKFDHDICKIGQDILELFIGNVDKLIKKVVEEDLAPAISKALDDTLQNVFTKIPFDISAAPYVANDGMTIPVDGASFIKATSSQEAAKLAAAGAKPVPMPFIGVPATAIKQPAGAAPRRHVFARAPLIAAAGSNTDLVVSVSEHSASVMSSMLQAAGAYNIAKTLNDVTTAKFQVLAPAVYNACPNCFIGIATTSTAAPVPTFSAQLLQLALQNFDVAISGVPQAGGAAKPLFAVSLNLTANMNNFQTLMNNGQTTIKFDIGVPTVDFVLKATSVGPLDISIVSGLVQIAVQDILVPDFNKNFNGFTLPSMDGFGLSGLEVLATDGQMALATNVTISL